MIVDSVERLWRKPVTKKLPTTVEVVKKIVRKQLDLYKRNLISEDFTPFSLGPLAFGGIPGQGINGIS